MLRRARVVPLVLIGLLFTGPGGSYESGHVSAAPRYEITHRRKLADGVWIKWMRDNAAPNRIKVLTLNPNAAPTLDVGLANGKLPGRERTSSMARRHDAIAAINGTYGLPWGRPVGVFVEDSFMKASPLVWGNGFGLTNDEQTAYIGHPHARVIMTPAEGGRESVIWSWNEPGPHSEPLLGFTPAGGQRARPPGDACSARLEYQGVAAWGENNDGIQREYTVHKVMCGSDPMYRAGRVVISAPNGSKRTERIKSLQEGQRVRLAWSVGWPGVLDAIGGNPVLVENGRNVAYACSDPFCQHNPRTGIGVTPSGRVLLVTVDGRQERSKGLTLLGMARLFRYLGATEALNLDGGGSTTMVVKGKVINKPSDPGGERAVSSSILVLPGRDPGEPPLLPFLPEPAETESVAATSPRAGNEPGPDPAITDPGSTGGMLDALAEQNRRRARSLTPALSELLQRFRSRGHLDR